MGVIERLGYNRFAGVALLVLPAGGLWSLMQLAALRWRPTLEITASGIVSRLGNLTDRRRMAWSEIVKIDHFRRDRNAISLRDERGRRLTLANRWFAPIDGADPDVIRFVEEHWKAVR